MTTDLSRTVASMFAALLLSSLCVGAAIAPAQAATSASATR